MNYTTHALCDILAILKEKYGITQTMLAQIIGVSIQAVTDMKAGRRRFTPAMADKLLDAFINETWAGWLADVLQPFADPLALVAALSKAKVIIGTPPPGSHHPPPQQSVAITEVPVLHVPWSGPLPAPGACIAGKIALPQWAMALAARAAHPYVLELVADDYAGRLRAGDQVLVVQDVWPDKEIMIVKAEGGLRLARNSTFGGVRESATFQWIALDSGVPLELVSPVATVVGIVMAKL